MKNIAVVAGNINEFNYWAFEQIESLPYPLPEIKRSRDSYVIGDRERWFFVSSDRKLRGIMVDAAIYYGTWTNRRDMPELREIINMRMRKNVGD